MICTRSVRSLVSALTMSIGVVGLAGCVVSTTTSTTTSTVGCAVDSSVSCASGTGWSCPGSERPQDSMQDLVCSTDGAGDFCCASSSCSYDTTVAGCTAGSVGYRCASGSPSPDQVDSALVCSVPTMENGVAAYCCFTNTTTPAAASTCTPDPSVAGCQPDSAGNPSYGFSCTGSENPDGDYSNVNCSMGIQGIDAHGVAATLYCCTHQ